MGNAGSMDSQQTDFRAHNVPLKLPMPEPGELEERFAIVLVSARRRPGAGPRGSDQAVQLTPAPSLSPGTGSEPPVPRGRLPPRPLWPPPPLLGSPPSPPRSAFSASRDGAGGSGLAAWRVGPEPIVWRERHLTARVLGRCGVGVKGRWRGPGRRGRRASEAFCLRKKNSRKPRVLEDVQRAPSPGPEGCGADGRMWPVRGAAPRCAVREGELGGGRRGLAEGSSPKREREGNPRVAVRHPRP